MIILILILNEDNAIKRSAMYFNENIQSDIIHVICQNYLTGYACRAKITKLHNEFLRHRIFHFSSFMR